MGQFLDKTTRKRIGGFCLTSPWYDLYSKLFKQRYPAQKLVELDPHVLEAFVHEVVRIERVRIMNGILDVTGREQ